MKISFSSIMADISDVINEVASIQNRAHMKLYVMDQTTKVYLRAQAQTRAELQRKLGKPHFTVRHRTYSINEVMAEGDNSNTATGAIIGGLLGLIGGPIGVITGGTVGGLIGNTTDTKEEQAVKLFNSSKA